MHATIGLGHVRGIALGINWSWVIVFALIVWSLAAAVFPDYEPGLDTGEYWAMAVAGAIAFFGSILLHELGHAVVAQREGMAIEGITLWVFGGVARFRGMFPSAGAELRIAIAGPLVTAVIAALCLSLAAVPGLPGSVDALLSWLGGVSIALLVFNMLPALPLDGGRVLRAILWWRTADFAAATRRAGAVAQVIGHALVYGGVALLFLGGPGGLWLALIGWFVLAAARAEMALGVAHELLAGKRVADVMVTHPVVAPAPMTVQDFLALVFARTQYAAYPVVRDEQTVGMVAVGDVLALPRADFARLTVGDVMVPLADALVVAPSAPLAEAATDLAGTSLGRALVTDDSRVVGLLSVTDIEHEVDRVPPPAADRLRRSTDADSGLDPDARNGRRTYLRPTASTTHDKD